MAISCKFRHLITIFFLVSLSIDAAPYRWRSVAPIGSGCSPPKCDQGKFPMAILPVAAPDGRLYSFGQSKVWISSNGTDWMTNDKTDWGERHGGELVYFRGAFWLFGGMRSWDDFRSDVWTSADGTDWKLVSARAGWPARRGHSVLTYKEKLWILGGALSSGNANVPPKTFVNDVWSSDDGISWKLVTLSVPWNVETGQTAFVFGGKLWMFEGSGRAWTSVDGLKWTQVSAGVPWAGRIGHGALVFDSKLWVFGGRERNDVWCSSDGLRWTRILENAPWSKRSANYSVVFKDRIWMFSGKTGRDDSWDGEIWAMESISK